MITTLIYACPELSGLNCAFERVKAKMTQTMMPSIGFWAAASDKDRLHLPTFYAPQEMVTIDRFTFVVFDRDTGAGALARPYRRHVSLIDLVDEAELLEHPSYAEAAVERIDALLLM